MDIQITGKNLEVLPKVRSYITKKLGKVDKYLDKIVAFEVVSQRRKNPLSRAAVSRSGHNQ